MKALTISQPYASLIAAGEKFVENRTWSTSYRGPLAIHAGLGSNYLSKEALATYPTGVIVAVADLVACRQLGELRSMPETHIQIWTPVGPSLLEVDLILQHEHAQGPWCWILQNVRPVTHYPLRGAQGIWEADLPPHSLKFQI